MSKICLHEAKNTACKYQFDNLNVFVPDQLSNFDVNFIAFLWNAYSREIMLLIIKTSRREEWARHDHRLVVAGRLLQTVRDR